MNTITLLLGGVRSGKSRRAVTLAEEAGGRRVLVATAEPRDAEMTGRIRRHRGERPSGWRTIEEPILLADVLVRLAGKADVAVVDCLTLWVSNLLERFPRLSDAGLERHLKNVVRALEPRRFGSILVSNEVGMGIVPAEPLVRRYADLLGRANQRIAGVADRVVLMVAGRELTIHDGGPHAGA